MSTNLAVNPVTLQYGQVVPIPSVAPFTIRSGITYQALLEYIRSYLRDELVPYVHGLPENFDDQFAAIAKNINDAVNAALASQDERFATTLAQIIAGQNVQLNDGTMLAVLKAANSASLDYLSHGQTTPERFIAAAVKDGAGVVTDWGPAIQAALTAGFRHIEFSATYYTIRTPIKVPSNHGLRMTAKGGLKSVVLNCFIPSGHESEAAIDVLGMKTGSGYNYAGFSMEGIHIRGNDSVCHGIRMQDLSYPWLENVLVEGFRGAGILLDLVMDGYLNVTVQDCGRTSGDYGSFADRTNNAKTLFAPLHLISSNPNDHCNMLRITGDVEQNKVSPYVWIHDAGAIGLQFTDIHAEVRNPADFPNGGNGFDFLLSDGADCEFTGMNLAATFRAGFLLGTYGGYHFSGGRYLSNIRSIGQGDGQLTIENAKAGNVITGVWGGKHRIVNSILNSLSIDYPGNGPFMVKDSVLDDIVITHAGAGAKVVIIDGCFAKTFTAGSDVQAFVRDNDFSGSVDFRGIGQFRNNGVGGTTTVDQSGIDFVPRSHRGSQNAAPQYGYWGAGDICWNSAPASGAPVGWVCTVAGSPGTWKAFGIIA